MSLDARLRHPRQPTGADYNDLSYAGACRGGDDGPDILQNQRMRLTGSGVDADRIYRDIIKGTVMQRPRLHGLLCALQPGDIQW